VVDKVDDNGNEVLRGAAEIDALLSKYNLRIKNADSEILADQLVVNQQNIASLLSNINENQLITIKLLEAILE